jgi:aminoglycoside 6'-N-acetyltransferase
MLILRAATRADLPLLKRWDQAPHVKAAGVEGWDWDAELAIPKPWREQFIAELAGRPIGFVELIDPKEEDCHYWGEIEANLRAIDIWIGESDYLGQGYGTSLMQLAIAHCFANPQVQAIIIDPLSGNTKARQFYERLGFKFIEQRWFAEDDCAVYRLERADYEAAAY